jgi:hypothetical protein
MKLRRLRLESFKRFRQPFAIEGFADGLNLFCAPNESGKSTVAEAIRAAFFERHRSGSVEHLRPWGDSAATPTVELDFELAGEPCRLTKAFLGRKRCELTIAGKAMSGTAAEDHLAELFGFRFPGKGASAPEHGGIPGLLWIRQGSSHELDDQVKYASDHLRGALGESVGELATSSGDAVLRTVETERNELLTPSGGRPRGQYEAAIAQERALTEEIASLQAEIETYRADVDRLAALRQEHLREAAERPWVAFGQQLADARSGQQRGRDLAARKLEDEKLLQPLTAHVASLEKQIEGFARQEHELESRRRTFVDRQEAVAAASSALQAWEARQADAAKADVLARERHGRVRRRADRDSQARNLQVLGEQREVLAGRLDGARKEQMRLTALQAELAGLAVGRAELGQLRALTETLRDAEARLAALATTLEFELLPGMSATVAGEPVPQTGRRTVVTRATVDIDGVGRIHVVPGGEDLQTLVPARDRTRNELADLLQRLGADSVAAVEERVRRHAEQAGEVRTSTALLAALAPKGVSELETELATLDARLAGLGEALRRAAAEDADCEAAGTVADAEAAETAARHALDVANEGLNAARLAAAQAFARSESAQAELAAAEAAINDPGRAQRKATALAEVEQARSRMREAESRIADVGHQLKGVNLALLQQDVERLEKSLAQIEATHRQRGEQITRLEVALDTKGARGLEETVAEKRRELGTVQRRRTDLERRARALDHLLTLLRDKRAALAKKLRAPLQRHLNHYLGILFPGAQVEVGDDLAPTLITRTGRSGAESGEFTELSVGAREQLGVVARLAYADLLREAGKPTLLILDDALVHTDEDRLGQMKRVLYDAAVRHQILIFTCHPVAWRDLGAPMRSLAIV